MRKNSARVYQLPLWSEDRLRFLVVLGTAVMSSWLWWVPLRCIMEGAPFEWANRIGPGVIRGAGMGGDFLVLVLLSAFFISVVFMGWRAPHAPFKAMLLVWNGVALASAAVRVIANPAAYRFRGDTFGLDLNLAMVMPPLWALLFVLTLWWVLRDARRSAAPMPLAWTPLNTRLLLPVLALVPVQIVMLRVGPMHDVTDRIGWVLTYAEWVLINLAFLPWVARKRSA